MDEVWLRAALIVFGSTMGSTGLWAWLRSRDSRRAATTRLMMGMAYETITSHGLAYIDRGWITKDEFEELRKYFFEPYIALGGNGTAQKIMEEVSRLPFRSQNRLTGITRNRGNEEWVRNVRVVTREEADTPSG